LGNGWIDIDTGAADAHTTIKGNICAPLDMVRVQ